MIKDVIRNLNKISNDRKFILFADGYQGVCIAEVIDEGTIAPMTPMKADEYELMDFIEGAWESFEQKREAQAAERKARQAQMRSAKPRRDVDTL